MSEAGGPWPTELRLSRGANTLGVTFDDGVQGALEAAELRRATPSAADRGHGAQARARPLVVDEGVRLVDLRLIGRYAVQIVFSDGHDTGFYTWPLLRRLVEGRGGPEAQD